MTSWSSSGEPGSTCPGQSSDKTGAIDERAQRANHGQLPAICEERAGSDERATQFRRLPAARRAQPEASTATARIRSVSPGCRRKALRCNRSTPPPTSTGWTRWTPIPGWRRSCAGRTRRCTPPSRGPSGSTRASPRPRNRTRSTGAISRPGRRACRSRSTCRPTAGTTPTTRGWPGTSGWPGWRSTPSTTCGSCSSTSRWTPSACR